MTDRAALQARAEQRLAEIAATLTECDKDRTPPAGDEANWPTEQYPCDLCAERIKDGDVIRDLLAALTGEAPLQEETTEESRVDNVGDRE